MSTCAGWGGVLHVGTCGTASGNVEFVLACRQAGQCFSEEGRYGWQAVSPCLGEPVVRQQIPRVLRSPATTPADAPILYGHRCFPTARRRGRRCGGTEANGPADPSTRTITLLPLWWLANSICVQPARGFRLQYCCSDHPFLRKLPFRTASCRRRYLSCQFAMWSSNCKQPRASSFLIVGE